MATEWVEKLCYDVQVWKGHWMVRSTHDTFESAHRAVMNGLRQNPKLHYRYVERVRRVPTFRQPNAPTAAQKFREEQADKMVIRRQALTYYKSGSNGTEVPQLPTEQQ